MLYSFNKSNVEDCQYVLTKSSRSNLSLTSCTEIGTSSPQKLILDGKETQYVLFNGSTNIISFFCLEETGLRVFVILIFSVDKWEKTTKKWVRPLCVIGGKKVKALKIL